MFNKIEKQAEKIAEKTIGIWTFVYISFVFSNLIGLAVGIYYWYEQGNPHLITINLK